jgi:hypothetical protein
MSSCPSKTNVREQSEPVFLGTCLEYDNLASAGLYLVQISINRYKTVQAKLSLNVCTIVKQKSELYMKIMYIPTCVFLVLNTVAVKTYRIVDMSIFDPCVVHIKRFHESSVTVDITSIVVVPQFQAKTNPMVSIFSANESRFINPVGNIRGDCSLQVIIGLLPSHSRVLYNFMYNNPYTYSSRPSAIYVLLLNPDTKTVVIYDDSILLPVSIFVLQVKSLGAILGGAMQSEPVFVYFCLSCKSLVQPVMDNKHIRSVTEYSYQKEWKRANLNIQAISLVGNGDITGCEKYIWTKWLATKGDPRSKLWALCNKPAAFWDLVLRSVHPNFTADFQSEVNFSKQGFSGSLSQTFFYKNVHPFPWEAASFAFHDFAVCGIMYCLCCRRSEITSLATWSVGSDKYEWASIICTTLVISAFVSVRRYLQFKHTGLLSYVESVINLLGIILRQGSYKSFLLAVFSLGMFSVSLIFENKLMSSLVVPDKNPVLDLAELVDAGYRILFHGKVSEFGSHLPFLRDEFDKFNVTYNESIVQMSDASITNKPSTFVSDKFSRFFMSTPAGKRVLLQRMKSMVPEHCVCSTTSNQFTMFPTYSFFQHKLTFRIQRTVQLLTEFGFQAFFDWDLQRTAPDFDLAPMNLRNVQEDFDSFISLSNLTPLLFLSGCMLSVSIVIFVFELRNHIHLLYIIWYRNNLEQLRRCIKTLWNELGYVRCKICRYLLNE